MDQRTLERPMEPMSGAFRFITIEGLDGVGKSTIVRLLADRLGGMATQTPDPALRAERLRIETDGTRADKWRFYMNSMVRQRPCFEATLRSRHVVCDRYLHSTLAYQWPPGAPLPLNLRELFADVLWPDLSILLVADEVTRHRRLHGREIAESIVNPADHRTDILQLAEQRFRSMPDLVRIETTGLTPTVVCKRILDQVSQMSPDLMRLA